MGMVVTGQQLDLVILEVSSNLNHGIVGMVVKGQWLDPMILVAFSNPNDSMILIELSILNPKLKKY